ncbi:condensation domain-containing protein [Streptomyces xanthochromogenes]|uniref:condensation domain-containing protein n=3 Tax=Streptomyces TaxID=1883 RepID=UPI003324A229
MSRSRMPGTLAAHGAVPAVSFNAAKYLSVPEALSVTVGSLSAVGNSEERETEPSVGQRLLWFLDRYRGQDGALNCPMMCRIRGPLDHSVLSTALDRVSARHDALRTVFSGGGRKLRQIVREPHPVALRHVDLRGETDAESAVRDRISEELATRIDATENAVRCTLWQVADDEHVLCVNMHHLVTDSWSCGVVFQDLCAVLDRLAGGTKELPDPGWQFTEFAEWQRGALESGELKKQLDYWRRELDGLALPPLPSRADPGPRRTALVRGELSAATVAALRSLSVGRGSSLFAAMLTLYYATLHRTTGRTDLAVASLYANRLRPQTRRTVGFLANMVVLRTRITPSAPVLDALKTTHATVVGGFLNQGIPYQLLPLPGSGNDGARADDIVFQMLAEPVYSITVGDLDIEVLVPDGVGSRFELELVLVPHSEGFHVLLFYNEGRFTPAFAEEFVQRFVAASELVAKNADLPVSRIC